MHQVFRVHRGHNLHVIHETRTGHNRIHSVYVLCRNEPVSGERDKGTATCPECLALDDPCDLNMAERNLLSRIVANDPSVHMHIVESNAKAKLIKRDLIDPDFNLTRRGKILALDWLERPAPAMSVRGVVHARKPLANCAKCDNTGVLDGFDKMSVDRYAKIRALDLHVTCIACLHTPA